MESAIGILMRDLSIHGILILSVIGIFFSHRSISKSISENQTKNEGAIGELSKSIVEQRKEFNAKLDRLHELSDIRDEKIEKELKEITKRISEIEVGYVQKEELFKMMSGWKQDLLEIKTAIYGIKK